MPYIGAVKITRFDAINKSNVRVTNAELLIEKDVIAIRHDHEPIRWYGSSPLSGAVIEQLKDGRMVLPPIDPSSFIPVTLIKFDATSSDSVRALLVDGRIRNINERVDGLDTLGIRSFSNGYPFIVFMSLIFSVALASILIISVYIQFLKVKNFEKYYRRYGKAQIADARKLIEFHDGLEVRQGEQK
ncbi:hypothetical protein AXW83_17600 [Bosea sp. PAMC 26642]|nr:hypothetical protein AXW83_17600 [Bosea sp. PAMC 26642]